MMNERIQELLVEAHKQTKGGIYSGHPSDWTEKFAELIVADCLKIVNRHEYSYHEADPLWETAQLIKEHFGIEWWVILTK